MAALRDISLIILAVATFIMALVPLVLLGGLTYGVWWLRGHENLPTWLHQAQAFVRMGRSYVERTSRAVVRPFLKVHSTMAQIQGMLRAVSRQGGDK